MIPSDIRGVGFTLLERGEHEHLEGFDYTKLTAINVCTTWGITRYGLHKRMPTQYEGDVRSMALEIGKAAHDAFAAIRLTQLYRGLYPDHAGHHAVRIFGQDRATQILTVIDRADSMDGAIRAAGMEAIATSGFTDSPWDKRRTVANLEAGILAYAANYDYQRYPVWVAERRNPRGLIGVEQPFAVLASFLFTDESTLDVKLTGKIDGLHWNKAEGTEVILHENKTGGRLDEAWSQSFYMSHQITGYCVAGTLLTTEPVRRAVVRGVQIPMPKMVLNGLQDVWVSRDVHNESRWITWLLHTYRLYQRYKDDPLTAPKYSHSCNRYFRSCPMIPFCYGAPDEQKRILDEMVVDEWNPLSEEYDG